MIPDVCLQNLQMKQHFAWLQTESRLMCLNLFARHRSCPLQCESWDVSQESTLLQATIRRNTTDIKYTGRTARRLHRLMTRESWTEVKAVTDYATMKTMHEDDAAKATGLYEVIGEEIDDAYIAELKKQVLHQDAIDEMQEKI